MFKICDAAEACRKSLQERVGIQNLVEDERAQLRLMDFNLCDARIGAAARSKAPLDNRLCSG